MPRNSLVLRIQVGKAKKRSLKEVSKLRKLRMKKSFLKEPKKD